MATGSTSTCGGRGRRRSSVCSGLLGPVFGEAEVDAGLDDRALLTAMLAFEAALARAQARAGLVPVAAAEAISAACVPEGYDVDDLGRRAPGTGAPVAPLVRD